MESGTHVSLPDGKSVGIIVGRVDRNEEGEVECIIKSGYTFSQKRKILEQDQNNLWHVQILGFYNSSGRDYAQTKPIVIQTHASNLSPVTFPHNTTTPNNSNQPNSTTNTAANTTSQVQSDAGQGTTTPAQETSSVATTGPNATLNAMDLTSLEHSTLATLTALSNPSLSFNSSSRNDRPKTPGVKMKKVSLFHSLGLSYISNLRKKCLRCGILLGSSNWAVHPVFWFILCSDCVDFERRENACVACGAMDESEGSSRHQTFKQCSNCKLLLCTQCASLEQPRLWISKCLSCTKCWVQNRSNGCITDAEQLTNSHPSKKYKLLPRIDLLTTLQNNTALHLTSSNPSPQLDTKFNAAQQHHTPVLSEDVSKGLETSALSLETEKWVFGIKKKSAFRSDFDENFSRFTYIKKSQLKNATKEKWGNVFLDFPEDVMNKEFPIKVKLKAFLNMRSGEYYVRTLENVKKGEMICEYAGEIIEELNTSPEEQKSQLGFFGDKKKRKLPNLPLVIKCSEKGNISHFISYTTVDSRVTVEVKSLEIDGKVIPRLGVFAALNIPAGTKLRLAAER